MNCWSWSSLIASILTLALSLGSASRPSAAFGTSSGPSSRIAAVNAAARLLAAVFLLDGVARGFLAFALDGDRDGRARSLAMLASIRRR